MLIRSDQAAALSLDHAARFERQMVDHCFEFFPKQCQFTGRPHVAEAVRLGVQKAAAYGYQTQREICIYISLMFMLGSYFDADPQIPWAGHMINNRSIRGSLQRIENVHAKTMTHLDAVAGEENEQLVRALIRARDYAPALFTLSARGEIETEACHFLDRIFPQKAEAQGDEAMRELVRAGIKDSAAYGIVTREGVFIYTGLMFFLGSGFDKDPQFPWAGAALSDDAANPTTKLKNLHGNAMEFLKFALT